MWKRLLIIVVLVFITAGCDRSQITLAEDPIIIKSIVFVVDGWQQRVQEGKAYLLGNEQYFDLQISGPVTAVEFRHFSGPGLETEAICSGKKVGEGLYRVQCETLAGKGYFIIYGQVDGKEIFSPTGEFILSAPSC